MLPTPRFFRLCLAALPALLVTLAGCDPEARSAEPAEAGNPDADATGVVRHAEGFLLREEPGYRVVEVVRPWRGAERAFRYLLVPRGEEPPDDVGDAQVVFTPVRTLVVLSTTHLGFVDALGLADRVVGISGAEWVYSPEIRDRLAAGDVADVGPPGTVDLERVLALGADLVMTSSLGDPSDLHNRLLRFGQAVAVNGEYAEASPLGRAEWIRFVAAFFERDAEAARLFDDVAAHYERLAGRAGGMPDRPTVLTQAGWRGSWYVPGGSSFAARLIDDAGGAYVWDDTDAEVSIQLDFEAVFARAAGADVWLNPGAATSLADLRAMDERAVYFEAFRRGDVYNHDRRTSPGGGYDYWESGVVRPDLILADLVRIFHPDLVPDHRFVYYRRLPPGEPGSD